MSNSAGTIEAVNWKRLRNLVSPFFLFFFSLIKEGIFGGFNGGGGSSGGGGLGGPFLGGLLVGPNSNPLGGTNGVLLRFGGLVGSGIAFSFGIVIKLVAALCSKNGF